MAMITGLIIILSLIGMVFAMGGIDETTVTRGLRLVVVLKILTLSSTWPFITYLALYQVRLSCSPPHLTVCLTLPTSRQR